MQRSPLLGMEFAANCAGTSGMDGTKFRTNSLGLRDTEIENDGRIRILSTGDSCTWGWGVRQSDAYPQVLQRALDRKYGKKFRVINNGRPGYTSYQGVLDLGQRALDLQPQIVLVGYGFNDTIAGGDVEEELERNRVRFRIVQLDDILLGNSRLWRWLRTLAPERPRTNLPLRSTVEHYKRNMVEIIRLIRERGAKPMIISFWGRGPKFPHLQALIDVGQELNVPIVYYEGPKLDVIHPTQAGYRQLAQDLVSRLDAEGYLAGASPPAQAVSASATH